MIYESRHQPLASRAVFFARLRRHGLWALIGFVIATFIGMFGFHELCNQSWVDAFLTTAMLIGGMGPVGSFEGGDAAKIFAGVYGLLCGFVFLGLSALVIAPILHRMMHRWHLEE